MKGSKYDAAFKREAIKMVRSQGEATSAVSAKFGVHIKTLYRWLDEERHDGNDAFPGKGKLNRLTKNCVG